MQGTEKGSGMSFYLSLTGMMGAARSLDVIGNNIANSQTIGFKGSKAHFADIFTAVSPRGGASQATAEGVTNIKLNQDFNQGSITGSTNPLDVAIGGNGFFRLQNGREVTYTRDGRFQLDFDANDDTNVTLVSKDKRAVTGYNVTYGADPTGTVQVSNPPQPIKFNLFMPGLASTGVSMVANLDSRATPPILTTFDPNDPGSFNHSTGVTVYDDRQPTTIDGVSDGTYDPKNHSHDLKLYWVRTDPATAPNTWQVYTVLDTPSQTNPVNGPFTMSFDTTGKIISGAALPPQSFTLDDGSVMGPLSIDMANTTQYGTPFRIDDMSKADGYLGGGIDPSTGFRVADNGEVWGHYSNGQQRRVGQLVLSNFVKVDALIPVGDGQWMKNDDPVMGTGKESFGIPGGGSGQDGLGMGFIKGGAYEVSNVDLSIELVGLIEQQRNYQVNAQTFKIQDEVLQNLINTVR